jgi:hypothetical protein
MNYTVSGVPSIPRQQASSSLSRVASAHGAAAFGRHFGVISSLEKKITLISIRNFHAA